MGHHQLHWLELGDEPTYRCQGMPGLRAADMQMRGLPGSSTPSLLCTLPCSQQIAVWCRRLRGADMQMRGLPGSCTPFLLLTVPCSQQSAVGVQRLLAYTHGANEKDKHFPPSKPLLTRFVKRSDSSRDDFKETEYTFEVPCALAASPLSNT